jgi:hypothetical protein
MGGETNALDPLFLVWVGCSGGGTALGVAASHTIMDAKSVMKVGAMPALPTHLYEHILAIAVERSTGEVSSLKELMGCYRR